MEQTRIKTFDELIMYFERPEVTFKEMNEILTQAIGSFFINDYTKEDAIEHLKVHWQKKQEPNCRAIFLDPDFAL